MPDERQPAGVLLGSGLSGVGDPFDVTHRIGFDEIPGVGVAGVAGHLGEIRTVRIGERTCCFILGRRHYYEGDQKPIGRLIGHLHATGVRELVVTSAAGSLDASVAPGELVLVDSILDLQFRRPAPGGPSGASRTQESQLRLCSGLRSRLRRAARGAGLRLSSGSLASLAGPSYETPAEIRALGFAGISVVSMSGAPETIAANALGMQVAMIAVVTNPAAGISTGALIHDDVVARGRSATGDLRRLITQFIEPDQVKGRPG